MISIIVTSLSIALGVFLMGLLSYSFFLVLTSSNEKQKIPQKKNNKK